MRKCFIILLAVLPVQSFAQSEPVKILFDITSKDTLTHQAVLRHVTGMSKAYPDASLEVVIYGGALPMVVREKSSVGVAVEKLTQTRNVFFRVCGETMKRYQVDKSALISGVEVVPDAIMEIVTKQREGWGYIKESHN